MALTPTTLVYEPVAALLETATGVPSFFGSKSSNTVKKRYNWEPGPITFSDPTEIGDYPRRLHDLAVAFDIYCRAPSYDEACSMMADLITALRQTLRGASYAVSSAEFTEASGESSTGGTWSLMVSLTVTMGLPESDLDQAKYTKATVTEVGFDTSAAGGDGVLIAPRD